MIHEDITLGPVRLIRGDCTLIAPTLEGVDAVITDPPYGMNWDTDTTRFSGGQRSNIVRGDGRSDYGSIAEDSEPFDPAPWVKYPRCVLFGSNHFGSRLQVGTTLVWVKKHDHLFGTFLSDAEVAWMKGGHGVYVMKHSFPPPARAFDAGGDPCRPIGIHPTQKPVALMSWCMDMAKVQPGQLILDPYMGSGTTLIAAIRTGRRAIGIEIDERHFRTAVERVKRELAQPMLPAIAPATAKQQDLLA